MEQRLTLEFDGGSRGNPGPAAIGLVIRAEDGTPLFTLGRFIGRATNNVAEYQALITVMEQALKLGARRVIIRGDSELVIKQMLGIYKVRHPDMMRLHEQAKKLLRQFDEAKFQHNLREKNELADKLANLAMDRKGDVTEEAGGGGRPASAPTPLDAPAPPEPKPGDRFSCARCGCAIELTRPSSLRPHQLKPFVCQCGWKMGE